MRNENTILLEHLLVAALKGRLPTDIITGEVAGFLCLEADIGELSEDDICQLPRGCSHAAFSVLRDPALLTLLFSRVPVMSLTFRDIDRAPSWEVLEALFQRGLHPLDHNVATPFPHPDLVMSWISTGRLMSNVFLWQLDRIWHGRRHYHHQGGCSAAGAEAGGPREIHVGR